MSRGRRRRYRRRRRRGRRRKGRRRRHRKTLILRQWQPDVVKRCFITGWLPLIICGAGHTQFNFITHMDDIPPRNASYGGNFTNLTFNLACFYDEFMHHRNRWSASNESTNSDMKGKTYNWKNYKQFFTKVQTKFNSVLQDAYNLVREEYQQLYTTTVTYPPEFNNRQYLSHDCGIYSPYFLTPQIYSPEWHTAWSYIRYNPLTDKGIGNRVCAQSVQRGQQ